MTLALDIYQFLHIIVRVHCGPSTGRPLDRLAALKRPADK